jgi:DNA-directed RNA polymerase subunit omega
MYAKSGWTYRNSFTNELLLKRFKSQFDLVRYAIAEAKSRVNAGRDYVHPDTENMATEILSEIAEGKEFSQKEEETDEPAETGTHENP